MQTEGRIQDEVSHLFRRESGKMVSVLTRVFGPHNIDLVEDVVQDTLLKALEQWRFRGIPENPSGWLYTVAKNKALDIVRRERLKNNLNDEIAYLLKSEYSVIPTLHELFSKSEIQDDQLRMMFVCCHPSISQETQVAMILKTLCGFGVREIASAFITNDEVIQKRIYRGKQVFREEQIALELPSEVHLEDRLDGVLQALYLLFNEGYSSASSDELIRKDLAEEALRLTLMLTENERTALPQVYALSALMMFHLARLSSRIDESGNILLLDEQDRSKWDERFIARGLEYLDRSASGDELTTYHIEAAIASVHATARSSRETDWAQIVVLYNKLYDKNRSPVTALNRSIAISELKGPKAGLAAIDTIENLNLLHDYFLLPAAKGEFYSRLNDTENAYKYFTEALNLTDSVYEKKLLQKKIARLE
ncbi:MAG TPA: sigma-70 family RNA polymerase sigma factor [Candidatus Kapabacteria bacterium]|nr:sigma-70 family RNA polymerase sigma factor [Candidatus Kapabacteria bacterium]